MRKAIFLVFSVYFACVGFGAAVCYAADDVDQEIGRYQIYSTPVATVLLDTKTGKVWKITADMSGKIRAEGVTVEGHAYANSEQDTLNMKVKEISLEDISEKNKNQCKDRILAEFSYRLDAEKISRILNQYRGK